MWIDGKTVEWRKIVWVGERRKDYEWVWADLELCRETGEVCRDVGRGGEDTE